MPPNIDLDAILALPPADRLALAEAIQESVGADEAGVSDELWAELKGRIDRYDADPSTGTPWEQIDTDAADGDGP